MCDTQPSSATNQGDIYIYIYISPSSSSRTARIDFSDSLLPPHSLAIHLYHSSLPISSYCRPTLRRPCEGVHRRTSL